MNTSDFIVFLSYHVLFSAVFGFGVMMPNIGKTEGPDFVQTVTLIREMRAIIEVSSNVK